MHYSLGALLVVALLTTLTMPTPVGAQNPPVVAVTAQRDTLIVTPTVGYAHLSLQVSTPDGWLFVTEGSGGPVAFNPFVVPEYAPPDGSYVWEVRLTPRGAIDPLVFDRALRARESGHDGPEHHLRVALHRTVIVQSGGFRILNGKLFMGGASEPQGRVRGRKSQGGPLSPFRPASLTAEGEELILVDQVIPDDLIVQGSACFGFDCVDNESFDFDTIRLKENNVRIKFEDTSTTAGFPSNDWQLTANDSASGGLSKFSIDDVTGATTPFTVLAGAPTNALFVDSMGRVGLHTATPVLDLHLNTGNTPATRLEQNSSGGFTAQTWDVAGNEANFFVRDITGGSRLPLRIRPGAPTSSIDIAASGNVGIGTASPAAKLDLHDSSPSKDTFAGIGVDPIAGPAFNLGYSGGTFGRGSGFINVRPDDSATPPNPSIRLMTANIERMIINNAGFVGIGSGLNPSHPLQMASGAVVTAGGVWTNASSRDSKADIQSLTADEARATLAGLSPVKFAYKIDPTERHVGFVAEDVPALVATKDRKSLSAMDVVAVLARVLQEQEKTVEAQRRLIDELAAKLSVLEAALGR